MQKETSKKQLIFFNPNPNGADRGEARGVDS